MDPGQGAALHPVVRGCACARTAGLLACINECSFWRSQNDRRDASRGKIAVHRGGDRARQLDALDAIRQSPEQAGRPAVRAHTVSRTSAVVTLRATRTATFPLPKHNPLMPMASWPAPEDCRVAWSPAICRVRSRLAMQARRPAVRACMTVPNGVLRNPERPERLTACSAGLSEPHDRVPFRLAHRHDRKPV